MALGCTTYTSLSALKDAAHGWLWKAGWNSQPIRSEGKFETKKPDKSQTAALNWKQWDKFIPNQRNHKKTDSFRKRV